MTEVPWFVLLFVWLAQPVHGTWSRVEVFWTVMAWLGIALNTVKTWLVVGDLHAAYRYRHAGDTPRTVRRRRIVGWWVVVNAIIFELMLAVFAFIGWVAGQIPPTPIDIGDATVPAGAVTGLALIGVEIAVIAAIGFTLWARVEADR